jgi:membrane fusion protein (multidrug efflux system)
VVTERRPNAVLVPQTAIVKSQGVDTVYVIDSNNVAALRTVSLGPQYQQSFIVESGLKAGERVVVEGTQKVRPDQKVVIK